MVQPTMLVEIWNGLVTAAKSGQKLPILTLVTLGQILLCIPLQMALQTLSPSSSSSSSPSSWNLAISALQAYNISNCLITTIFILIPAYILLFHLYKHSITNIFNRKIPPSVKECIPSFMLHLQLLKPLDIIFRYITYRFRVLPDIIVLGEVRCGTTSFCQHLATALKEEYFTSDDDDDDDDDGNDDNQNYFIDCHTPFCLWLHPELDHKETFYFVGHYLGMVTPKYYRMCFPLYITKWWNECIYYISSTFTLKSRSKKKRKPLFISFDGCAQYMTSPTAPYLIAQAYKDANQPPPILISCVRDPVLQSLSWWKYESNAQEWGESIGLREWNTNLRSTSYPPKTIEEALEFTQSNLVDDAYLEAELLFQEEGGEHGSMDQHWFLPPWAMSWPGGQMTGIGRNGKFSENITRFENTFSAIFGPNHSYGTTKASSFVSILHLDKLTDEQKCKRFIVEILEKVSLRKYGSERAEFMNAIESFTNSKKSLSNVHRNASASGEKKPKLFNDATIKSLEVYFESDKIQFNNSC